MWAKVFENELLPYSCYIQYIINSRNLSMSHILDNFSEEENEKIGAKMLLSVWIKPGKSFKVISKDKSFAWSFLLLFILGAVSFNELIWSVIPMLPFELPLDVALIAFISGIAGIFYFSLFSFIFHLFSKVFKCNSTFHKAIAIFSWSRIPQIIGAVILKVLIRLYDYSPQSDDFLYSNDTFYIFITYSVRLIFVFWTLIIFIVGIRSVYNIKLGKAIVIGILPGLVILIIVALISLIYTFSQASLH